MKGSQSTIADSFPSFLAQEELLAKVIEFFPYPIQVYTPDGTSLLVNTAMLTEYHAISPEQVVGKYNVLKDPAVLASSQLPILKQAFQGKTVFFTGIKVPLEQIAERYGIQDLDVEAVYQDITLFPIIDEMKQLLYVVAFLINRRVYRGITEIEKAKEYIETHWLDSFSAEETAKAACLSKAHFSKLFKQHTGLTPKEYYINYKISKVKEKLLDTNLSIAQAFAACNIKYNGYSAGLFKKKVGLSPSAYRLSSKELRVTGNEDQAMKNQPEDLQKKLAKSFQFLSEKQELLAKVIEFFPYPIQIFSPDGTVRLINRAVLDLIGIKSVESHVGKYNVFEDPIVRELGVMEEVKQVLTGKTVYITDFNAPYQDMIRYFNVDNRDIHTICSDITCFPLMNSDGVVEYFAAVFIFKKVYRGKEEIERGKQYIETHWQEPFDAEETAKGACLSKAHFTKLFKQNTGVTPKEYYINYKISKLKEKLLDTNLSIAQAFAACNMNYNGYSASLFKKKVGLSPSEFRKKYR